MYTLTPRPVPPPFTHPHFRHIPFSDFVAPIRGLGSGARPGRGVWIEIEGHVTNRFLQNQEHLIQKALARQEDRPPTAAIDGLRVHDLRHSFATLAVSSGDSLYGVQKFLGHSDIGMTQRYAHMADDGLQRATDGRSSAVEQASGTTKKQEELQASA